MSTGIAFIGTNGAPCLVLDSAMDKDKKFCNAAFGLQDKYTNRFKRVILRKSNNALLSETHYIKHE